MTFFSGPYNNKADTVTMHFELNQTPIELSSDKIITITNDALKQSSNIFYESFQSNLPQTGQATSFAQGRKAWYHAIEQQQQKLLDAFDYDTKTKEEQVAVLNKVAAIMKNSIVVTETMKTFNQYSNKIGFVGGSLGPDIITQIQNFAELFESAGVPLTAEEQDWLIIALVNCSSQTLGQGNRKPIEKYLSVMAGFAVFDEGSAELELLTNSMLGGMFKNNSPQIMHLYKLNGIYFPGSYILQRIYDNLKTYMGEASSKILNNDGVSIRATASEELVAIMIPLEKQDGKKYINPL